MTYNQAVDGVWGKSTQAAYERMLADKKGDSKKKQQTEKVTEEKQNTPITFMPQIIDEIENRRFVPYPVSSNKNEQAVSDHKVNSGVEEPYWILDRQKGTLSHKTKDKTLRTFRVMTGLSKNEDGYNFYPSFRKGKDQNYYDLEKHAMVTPAGIFTFQSSNYQEQPAFRLIEAARGNNHSNRKTSAVAHIMPKSRQSSFNNGRLYGSYGCINLPQETLDYMIRNNAVFDSLYVLPVRDGNYIYESYEDGHPLKTHYGNAPSTIEGTHYDTPFKLDVKYNIGY